MSNNQSKSAILSAVRQALKTRPHVVDPGRPFSLPVAKIVSTAKTLAERFSEEITKLGSTCYIAASNDDARKYITEYVGERGISRVAVSNSPLLSDIGIVAALQDNGAKTQIVDYNGCKDARELDERKRAIRETLLHAELGITSATYGIADTGTLVIGATDEANRLTSLMPTVHLAVVTADQLMPDLPSVMERLSRNKLNQAITLITGPSRTADIELTLTIGVHGPKELHVVIIT